MTADRDELATSESDASLSWDATFDALSHQYRRDVLRFVSDAADRTATVDDLASHLVDRAAERADDPPRRERIAAALHHVHLPTLSDAGVVDYDARSKVVRYRGCDRLECILKVARSADADRESARY